MNTYNVFKLLSILRASFKTTQDARRLESKDAYLTKILEKLKFIEV